MIKHRRDLFMQRAAIGFVPLDADVLLKHTKTTTTIYTKTPTTAWDGYAYRDIDSVDDSEIRMQNPDNGIRRFVGFYNKTLVDPITQRNFDYGMLFAANNFFYAFERGVQKYNGGAIVLSNGVGRVKKITGAAEYYYDDVLKYTSLQDFNGAEFGCMAYTNGKAVNGVEYKL